MSGVPGQQPPVWRPGTRVRWHHVSGTVVGPDPEWFPDPREVFVTLDLPGGPTPLVPVHELELEREE